MDYGGYLGALEDRYHHLKKIPLFIFPTGISSTWKLKKILYMHSDFLMYYSIYGS